MDREDKKQVDRGHDEQEDAQRDKQAAAASTGKTKEPEQDETANYSRHCSRTVAPDSVVAATRTAKLRGSGAKAGSQAAGPRF